MYNWLSSFHLQDKEVSQEAKQKAADECRESSESDSDSNSTVKEAKHLVAVLKVSNSG